MYVDIRCSKGFTGELQRVNRDDSDLTVTVELKNAAVKKMRLHVTGYFQGEYNYMISTNGLIMNYKESGVNKIKTVKKVKMVSRPFAKKKKKNNIFRLQKEKKKNKYNKKTKVAIGRNLLIKALQNSFDFLDVEFKFLLTKSMKKVYKKKETYTVEVKQQIRSLNRM